MEASHWKRLWIPAVLALAAYLALLKLGAPERVTSLLLGGVPAALGLALGRRTGGLTGLLAFVLDSAVDAGFRGLSMDGAHFFLFLAYTGIGLSSGWVGERLRLRERSLDLLYRASREISRQPDEEAVLRALPQMVHGLLEAGAVGLLLPEAEGYRGLYWVGYAFPEKLRLGGGSLAGKACREGPQWVQRMNQDPDGLSLPGYPVRLALAFPLWVEGECAGVLCVVSRRPLPRELFPLLQSFCELASEAMGRRRALRRLAEAAYTDPLTGLRSRRSFEERLAEEWARAKREGDPLGLVLLDMNGFKAINDTIGHTEGDALLRAVAQALKGASRASDLLFRWAGDEFAVLLPAADLEGACQAGERYAQAIAELSPWKGQIVSAAFGHASNQEGFADPQTLFNVADHRLYNTKRVSAVYPDVAEPHS